jgi:propanediol dehydratase large subunit
MDVEKTMEFILEQTAQTAALQARADEHLARHDRDIAKINAILRRAVRLAVQEARAGRKRRNEADERLDIKMDQLASAHLMNEEMIRKLGEKIDRFVDDRRNPGGNGHPQ